MTGESITEGPTERLAVLGTGTIACGLASIATRRGPVTLWARSASSAGAAGERLAKLFARDEDARPDALTITSDLDAIGDSTYAVEAIVEDVQAKSSLFGEAHALLPADAVLATTTSSLSVAELAGASGRPDRFAALHVFNPVPKMALVELAFPPQATADAQVRTRALCEALGKTVVEVPDVPGFVVNRLLFPFLFSAVELMEETGLDAAAVDCCMTLGAGHPLGPLALLDLVGLDVAVAIGDAIGKPAPPRIHALVADGALGRKSGRGFHTY